MKAEHLVGFLVGGIFGAMLSGMYDPGIAVSGTVAATFLAAMIIGSWQERNKGG